MWHFVPALFIVAAEPTNIDNELIEFTVEAIAILRNPKQQDADKKNTAIVKRYSELQIKLQQRVVPTLTYEMARAIETLTNQEFFRKDEYGRYTTRGKGSVELKDHFSSLVDHMLYLPDVSEWPRRLQDSENQKAIHEIKTLLHSELRILWSTLQQYGWPHVSQMGQTIPSAYWPLFLQSILEGRIHPNLFETAELKAKAQAILLKLIDEESKRSTSQTAQKYLAGLKKYVSEWKSPSEILKYFQNELPKVKSVISDNFIADAGSSVEEIHQLDFLPTKSTPNPETLSRLVFPKDALSFQYLRVLQQQFNGRFQSGMAHIAETMGVPTDQGPLEFSIGEQKFVDSHSEVPGIIQLNVGMSTLGSEKTSTHSEYLAVASTSQPLVNSHDLWMGVIPGCKAVLGNIAKEAAPQSPPPLKKRLFGLF